MPFTMREIHWMVEGKMEVLNDMTYASIDATFRSMANQMAMTKACHSGKRANPDEFYKSPIRKKQKQTQPINKEGFAMLKRTFVKGAK